MTAEASRLDAIEARANAATKGPWSTEAVESGRFAGVESRVYSLRGSHILLSPSDGEAGQAKTIDAEFIAAARTDVPYLLALARKQQAAIEAVKDLVVAAYVAPICTLPGGYPSRPVEAFDLRAALDNL